MKLTNFISDCTNLFVGWQPSNYSFNNQEHDDETWGDGNEYDYGDRMYDPRLARFLSVDPIAMQYPSWSPYIYAMNRPIDGVDLDGKEWKSEHKWGDKIEAEETIKSLKEFGIYTEGMTYTDLWQIMAPAMLCHASEGTKKFDCADVSIFVLVKFASMYKLPIKFTDKNNPEKPTFDNDNYGWELKTKGKKGKIKTLKSEFKEGQWEKLSDAIGSYYGAEDLFDNRELTTAGKEVTAENADKVLDNLEDGDLVTWNHLEGTGHSTTVSEVHKGNDEKITGFGTFQGNAPEIIVPKYSAKELENIKKQVLVEKTDQVRVHKWNFNKFDK